VILTGILRCGDGGSCIYLVCTRARREFYLPRASTARVARAGNTVSICNASYKSIYLVST